MKTKSIKSVTVLLAVLMLFCTALIQPLAENTDIVRPGKDDAENSDYLPDISLWNAGINLTVKNPPSVKGRLTKSENETGRVSLFAPHSTYDGGWLDADKKFDGTDGNLCWAASCSNILSWYLKDADSRGVLTENIDILNETEIFDRFRGTKENPVWPPDEGQDPVDGFSWYFTGGIKSGAIHNTADGKGGFLKELVPYDLERFSFINYNVLERNVDLYGDTSGNVPYVLSFTNNHAFFQTYRGFSDIIIWQLHYGPAVLNIGRTAASSHAVTLWGCDYDPDTRLVTGLYLVDNDDRQHQILRASVNKKGNDTQGVEIHYRPKLKDPNQEAEEITGVIGTDFLIPMGFWGEETEKLISVSVGKLPDKVEYIKDVDTLDLKGSELVLNYDSGKTKVIDITYNMVSGFDNTVAGTQTITVAYKGFTDTFEVTVKEKSLRGDINADGKITASDYLMLKRTVLGTYILESEECGDINRDGKITAADYLMLKRAVLGTYTIK